MIKIRTKKKLGQHFLNNDDVAKKIISYHSNRKNVLEIGPGIGALTKFLVDEVDNLLLIEIDKDCILFLKKKYKDLNIIEDDVLNIEFNTLFNKNLSIISNLPYNISSQVFFKILENRDSIDEFTFLIQKEVAQRVCS